ncbi:MAG: nucleoid-associated protein [Thiovulaceae bacterium]|nr:nucleoid-associated protein [Sulfurimonadaceae bacterium]
MSARTSVLSEEQRRELQVENFIYHIIKKGEEQPSYLSEVILANDRQRNFFKNIIAETGQGTQYSFISESSNFKTSCLNIIKDPDKNFVIESCKLAQDFLSRHTGGSMSDGVFIVARVSIPKNTTRVSFIALIKVDYMPVMRQHRVESDENRVELEEILEALSEQKISVQKRALIDINNQFDWDVLAVERRKSGAVLDTEDAITDYFKKFMDIRLRETDSALTKRVVVACHQWAKSYDGDLNGRTPTDIRQSVINLMDAYENGQIDYDDLKGRICTHPERTQQQRIEQAFNSYMDEQGLGGVSFSPKPKSISSSARKGVWETDTGIKIIWNGPRSEDQLNKRVLEDGSVVITIRANEITEKE